MAENQRSYDIAIVGGGINGCGIARDAAGRGQAVFLCEQNDLASGTSSASTKLIHGGLRYLEYYEFRLVREALQEREVLLRMAPHIIWPLRFVLPHHKGLRPAWLIRLGLFLYDHLGGRKLLPATRSLNLRQDIAGTALKEAYTRAFEYSDCWVQDSRLVVLNALDAREKGADLRTRTRCTKARREDGLWVLSIEDENGNCETIRARALVNAAGPWVTEFLTKGLGLNAAAKVRMVKGSHIILPRLFEHDRAYIFQNSDNRIVFAIPYEQDFTLIGTTDEDFEGDPATAEISRKEIGYLIDAVNGYFKTEISAEDVVTTYAGVRPLYDDGASAAQSATRDYVLKLQGTGNEAPLLNIFGGKITTYRRLAEAALEKLDASLGTLGQPWTKESHLPGGDFSWDGAEQLALDLCRDFPFLERKLAQRLVRAYGTRARDLLGKARSLQDLGQQFGADLYEAEVVYLMDREWACSARDVVWRRSKLVLRMTREEQAALDDWMRRRRATSRGDAAE